MLLWVLRPRVWPDYYYLGVLEVPLLAGFGARNNQDLVEERRIIAPMKYAKI